MENTRILLLINCTIYWDLCVLLEIYKREHFLSMKISLCTIYFQNFCINPFALFSLISKYTPRNANSSRTAFLDKRSEIIRIKQVIWRTNYEDTMTENKISQRTNFLLLYFWWNTQILGYCAFDRRIHFFSIIKLYVTSQTTTAQLPNPCSWFLV